MDLFEIFGIVLDWGFLVQVSILITLLYIAHDISKIRDFHQYKYEQNYNKDKNK